MNANAASVAINIAIVIGICVVCAVTQSAWGLLLMIGLAYPKSSKKDGKKTEVDDE